MMKDNEFIRELNRQKGYILCEYCTNKTEGNWEVWHNPYNLCERLKAKMNEQEIKDAQKYYDEALQINE